MFVHTQLSVECAHAPSWQFNKNTPQVRLLLSLPSLLYVGTLSIHLYSALTVSHEGSQTQQEPIPALGWSQEKPSGQVVSLQQGCSQTNTLTFPRKNQQSTYEEYFWQWEEAIQCTKKTHARKGRTRKLHTKLEPEFQTRPSHCEATVRTTTPPSNPISRSPWFISGRLSCVTISIFISVTSSHCRSLKGQIWKLDSWAFGNRKGQRTEMCL